LDTLEHLRDLGNTVLVVEHDEETIRRADHVVDLGPGAGAHGDGMKCIEMNFLPDVYVLCDVCRGARYNRETLSVRYKGMSIADLLDTTIEEALPLLENIPQIKVKLQTLIDVGLSYIKLGQSA